LSLFFSVGFHETEPQSHLTALARQWAGLQSEAELLTKEIDRLRGILIQAISIPKQTGTDSEARGLERAITGETGSTTGY
jgi:hypothetical protein